MPEGKDRMSVIIRKGRAIASALLLTAAALLGVGVLSPTLPRAHANGFSALSSAVVWAEYPCIALRNSGVYPGTIVFAHHEVQRVNSTLSSQEVWAVVTIGVTTGCSEGIDVLAPFVPEMAGFLGPWMSATRSGIGLTAAYWDKGRVCNVLDSQGAAAAVDSMYSTFASNPLGPVDAKRAAIAGTIAYCPWNLGVLRSYFGG